MTVFGFYLRLEDIAKRSLKQKIAKQAVVENAPISGLPKVPPDGAPVNRRSSTEFVNLAFEEDQLPFPVTSGRRTIRNVE